MHNGFWSSSLEIAKVENLLSRYEPIEGTSIGYKESQSKMLFNTATGKNEKPLNFGLWLIFKIQNEL